MTPPDSDWIFLLFPIRSLFTFLAGAYVWQKAKDSTLSLRFVLVLAINAGLSVNVLLAIAGVMVSKWIM